VFDATFNNISTTGVEHFHIPDLITKYTFLNGFNKSYFPYGEQNGTHSSKSNEKAI